MNTAAEKVHTTVHECSNCTKYTAVVDGWCYNFEKDGFTPSNRVHTCGESDRRA